MKAHRTLLTEARDLPCLRFLWRWKVASTYALCQKFYGEASLHTGYKRLLKLEDAGFIQSKTDPTGAIHVWTLTQKGFLAIRHLLPPLKEEGYKAENLIHDWLVSAIHLGDLLIEKRDSIGLISEQELRRVEPEFFPAWVPKSTLHRPDGYTRIEEKGDSNLSSGKTIALEVELHLKRTKDYEAVADFYRTQGIHEILWIVPKDSMARRIESLVHSHSGPSVRHSFALLGDVLTDGSNTIARSQGGERPLSQCLYPRLGSALELVPMPLLLNARKSPHKSKTSLQRRLHGIFQVA